MLLDMDFRKGRVRVGIFGITEADQRSGFPIGVYLFGAFGAEANNARTASPKAIPREVESRSPREFSLLHWNSGPGCRSKLKKVFHPKKLTGDSGRIRLGVIGF
jgi:hypothetical protein